MDGSGAVRLGSAHGVVLPVRTDPTGQTGPTRREAAGPDWRRSSWGHYVNAYVVLTPEQRIGEAGVLVPRFGAVTGWASLSWQGGWWFPGTNADGSFRPVPVAMAGHAIRPQRLMLLTEERWSPLDVRVVDGLRVVEPARSVCFEMRYAETDEAAVVALEMAAFHDLVSVSEATAWALAHPAYTGIARCRAACAVADENAWSPQEFGMRRDWTDAGFPRPRTNRPVFDLDGRHLGTPDVVDPVAGVLGEYDGALHLEGKRRSTDIRREAAFRAHGLEVVTKVASDIGDPSHFQARLREAYLRAGRRPASERQWTMDRPHWWPATFTVSQRRALSEADRATWLKHRQAG